MLRFALLVTIFLSAALGREKDQNILLRTNVIRELMAYHVSPETYTIVRVTDDHVVIAASEHPQDSIEQAIQSSSAAWEKDPRFLVFLYHHHLSGRNSWRTKTSPSFHITQIDHGIYSVDIDLHAPSFRHPVESVKHLKEILWHLVSRTKTDQGRISILLMRTSKK